MKEAVEDNVNMAELMRQTLNTVEQLTKTVKDLNKTMEILSARLSAEEKANEDFELEAQQEQKFYPFKYNFVAGAVALPLSFAMMHPVDTIKTRMQSNLTKLTPTLPPKPSPNQILSPLIPAATNGISAPSGFFMHLKLAIKEAGPSMLSRGFITSVGGAIPQGGLRLGTYGYMQSQLHPYFDSPILQNAIAAVCGDLASAVAKVPREVITQRLQTGMYKTASEAITTIYRQEGWKGYFTGFLSTTSRDIPFMVVLFVSYEQFKHWKIRLTTTHTRYHHHGNGHVDHPWSDFETILWGGISGALAGFSTTPFDVIKTRIMTAKPDLEKPDRSMRTAFLGILRDEGARGLWIGALPRSGWWFCVCSIFFASFERIRALMADKGV